MQQGALHTFWHMALPYFFPHPQAFWQGADWHGASIWTPCICAG